MRRRRPLIFQLQRPTAAQHGHYKLNLELQEHGNSGASQQLVQDGVDSGPGPAQAHKSQLPLGCLHVKTQSKVKD